MNAPDHKSLTCEQVPLLDLKAQYATIREEVLAAVAEVLDSQLCVGGPRVAELEQTIARLCGCKYGVAVSSGTDAILNTLMGLDIGPGDEVITTPFTFFATVGSILRTGAAPVFVDIDASTFNIDPGLVEQAVTPRTRAVIPVHLFGQPADMDPLMHIADKYGLAVIEDAAQAIGSTYKGRPAGSIGLAGCLSFFPSKNLGGAGDGGMVVTNDPGFARRLELMRSHGADPKYFHRFVGGNFRLDAIQAAILLAKLPHLDAWTDARRRNAAWYDRRFAGTVVRTPFVRRDCSSVYNQYVVRVPDRDGLFDYLKARGVGCEIYYPLPMHLQPCLAGLGYEDGDLPEAERASKQVLALPVFPELTEPMREHIARTVLAYYS